MENADSSAIYYPVAFADEAEALAYGESAASQVSQEGIVLLTNQAEGLPLPKGSRLSLFSTSSVNPVLGGTGSGRVNSDSSDTLTYSVSVSDTAITAKLSSSDPNLYEGSDSTVTWLSRSDWTGTFPTESAKVTLTQLLIEDLQNNHYDPEKVDRSLYTIPVTEADNGLRLYDMMGKSYDDPDWELLLDQMSFDETVDFIRDAFHGRSAVESIQSPGTRDENGPTGLNTTYMAGEQTATAFASPFVMGSTFNNDLIYQVGYVIGNDCLGTVLSDGIDAVRSG